MEFPAALCVFWLCLNCSLQSAEAKTKDDVPVRYYYFTSPENKTNDKLLSEVKEFDRALEDLIKSNQNVYESLGAAQPASALLKSKNDLEPDHDRKLESEKDIENLLQTMAPSEENQKRRLYEDEDLNFADLLSLPPPSVFQDIPLISQINRRKQSQNEIVSGLPNKANKRNNPEDKINNKNEISNDSQDSTVKPKNETTDSQVKSKVQRRQTQPMDHQGKEILKLLKQDVMDNPDDLESLEEIQDLTEKPPSDSGHLKGINAKYLLKLLSEYYGVKKKAEDIMGGGIEAIKDITTEVMRLITEMGR